MDMWGNMQVFFKECIEEKVVAIGREKGRTSWRAWRA